MNGDRKQKLRSGLRSDTDRDTEKKEASIGEAWPEEHGDFEDEAGSAATLSAIRKVMSEVMAKEMSDLKSDMRKDRI